MEREYPGIYFAPQRWGTVDGYMPWRTLLTYAAALPALRAMDRLAMAAGINLAFAPNDGEGPAIRRKVVEEAYPEEG